MFFRKESKKYIRVKKKGNLVALISADNFVCAFINDYNKRRKVKIRLKTGDFIDISTDDFEEGKAIIDNIHEQLGDEEYETRQK